MLKWSNQVPLYDTLGPDAARYIIEHAELTVHHQGPALTTLDKKLLHFLHAGLRKEICAKPGLRRENIAESQRIFVIFSVGSILCCYGIASAHFPDAARCIIEHAALTVLLLGGCQRER